MKAAKRSYFSYIDLKYKWRHKSSPGDLAPGCHCALLVNLKQLDSQNDRILLSVLSIAGKKCRQFARETVARSLSAGEDRTNA